MTPSIFYQKKLVGKAGTYLGIEHQVGRGDEDVGDDATWEHHVFVLFPVDGAVGVARIKRVERALLKNRLQDHINFGSLHILDHHAHAKVFHNVSVQYADCQVV